MKKYEKRLDEVIDAKLEDVAAEVGVRRLYGEPDALLRERARAVWRRANGLSTDPMQYGGPHPEEGPRECVRGIGHAHLFDVSVPMPFCIHCKQGLHAWKWDGVPLTAMSADGLARCITINDRREEYMRKPLSAALSAAMHFAMREARCTDRDQREYDALMKSKRIAKMLSGWRCSECGVDMPRCGFKGCGGTIAAVMKHEIFSPQASEQWTRAAATLCSRHAIEKLRLESGPGMSPEGATDAGRIEAEPITCDVGADWED